MSTDIYKKALENISNIGEWRSLTGDACDMYKMACDALEEAKRPASNDLTDEEIDNLAAVYVKPLGGDHYSRGEMGIKDDYDLIMFARVILVAQAAKDKS